MSTTLFTSSSALITSDGRYRYWLRREIGFGHNTVCFVMYNPSVADHEKDDPTIRRCIGFAQAWGFSSLTVVNLFAFRATKPAVMRLAADPIGPDNDDHILECTSVAQTIIAAWGAQPMPRTSIACHNGVRRAWDRDEQVLKMLSGRIVHCLKKTSKGRPQHPLFVPAMTRPEIYRDAHG